MSIWVLVADNSRARIFTTDKPAGALTEVRDLTHPEARLHGVDLITDKPGQDKTDIHKQDGAERFASSVCAELESARAGGAFSKLYVVAAPGFLGMLRKHQSNSLKRLVVGEVDKNLATQDPVTIRGQLPTYL
jgi:protein required for attachment to host cells